MPDSESQRILVTRRQQFRLASGMTTVDWANRMNDVSRWKIARGSKHRLARRQPIGILSSPDFAAGLKNRWPAGSMDRAINAAATQQRRICCVDDRSNILAS